jgi:predicted dehydrogenase
MALDLTAEQKEQGRQNFAHASGDLTRRGFMKSMAAAGAVAPVSAAVYFGYQSWKGNKAVKTALIGGGDEGGVLVGEHNPEFMEIVAVADIRPDNMERIFKGEKPPSPRKGLEKIYGPDTAKGIRKFGHYDDLFKPEVIKELGLEAVIIALPLHMHAPCAVAAMEAGLHVLCEKLMARNIPLCKQMIRKAKEKNRLLAIGHQRHYSMLYAHAQEVVASGILGDIRHIRALWHRNNSWPIPPGADWQAGVLQPTLKDGWFKPLTVTDYKALQDQKALWDRVNSMLKEKEYDSVEQLIRWRLYDKTGGGLMAELGSHQLDASSIFLGKVKPLAVTGVGGRYFYGDMAKAMKGEPTGPNPRESDDGVYVTYEFPGRNYYKRDDHGKIAKDSKGKMAVNDAEDIVIVTYSSMNTNSFEKYGECLMGSRGTMIVESEGDVFLFREPEPGKKDSGGRATAVKVTGAGGGKPAMEAASTWAVANAGPAIVKTGNASGWGDVSRGYREEMEHFAFCVRELKDAPAYEQASDGTYVRAEQKLLPKCHGEVAMADAILALTANMAMDRQTNKGARIEFEDHWFDSTSDEVPETKYGKKAQKA